MNLYTGSEFDDFLADEEIDNMPEEYLSVVYRMLRAFTTPLDRVLPFQPSSDDIPTPDEVVAKIQRLPKDAANIEPA